MYWAEWESYSDEDGANVCDRFDVDHKTVYMRSSCVPAGDYHVTYYDASSHLVVSEQIFDHPGCRIKSQLNFPDYPNAAYNGDWEAVLTSDTLDIDCPMIDTFYVAGGAVPEFPVAVTTIIVSLICAAAYMFMRKKHVPPRKVGLVR